MNTQPQRSVQLENCRSPRISVHSTAKPTPSQPAPSRNDILNVTILSPGMLSQAALLRICASSDSECKITWCASVSWATLARMKAPRSSFFGLIAHLAGGRGICGGLLIRFAVVTRNDARNFSNLHRPRPSALKNRSSERQKKALRSRARRTAIHPAGSRWKLAKSQSVMHRTLPKGLST